MFSTSANISATNSNPSQAIALSSLSVPVIKTREEALKALDEYQKEAVHYSGVGYSPEKAKGAYEKATALLESLRKQGILSEADIDHHLVEVVEKWSQFERMQGNNAKADELAAQALKEPILGNRKHKLSRDTSGPLHFSKKSQGTPFDRPQSVPQAPEFEQLIQRLSGMGLNSAPFFDATSTLVPVEPVYAWVDQPEQLTGTAHLAWCLREGGKRQNTEALQPFLLLAERLFTRFGQSSTYSLARVHEVVVLAQTPYISHARQLISQFQPKPESILKMAALQGMVALTLHCIRQPRDEHFAADCTRLLHYIQGLLGQVQPKDNKLQLGALLQAASLLLDAMFEAKLNIEKKERDELDQTLKRLEDAKDKQSHMDAGLAFQAKYARQALDRLYGSHQEGWRAAWDILQDFGGSAAYGVGASQTLDPDKIWEAFQRFTQGVRKIKHVIEQRRSMGDWYLALHYVSKSIELGYLVRLESFAKKWVASISAKKWVSADMAEYFLFGLCTLLERVVCVTSDAKTKEGALRFLQSLAQDKERWGNYPALRDYANETLTRIGNAWLPLSPELMERLDYAPDAWHPFWQSSPANILFNEVQGKAQRHLHLKQQTEEMGALTQQVTAFQTTVTQQIEAVSSHITLQTTQLQAPVFAIREGILALQTHLLPQPAEADAALKLRAALSTYYAPHLKIQRISGKALALADCYVNLAIVEGESQRAAERQALQKQQTTFHRLATDEYIKRTNLQASIPIKDLFDARPLRSGKSDIPNKILIQGRAGIGKTTLCKKLVDLYQQGQWQDRFDAVLWIPLRELKSYQADSVASLLSKKFFSRHTEKDKLIKALQERTDNILFILDGLDEVTTEIGQATPLGELLGHLLRQPHTVLTSRPAGVSPEILSQVDLELETVGFSQANVKSYLTHVEPQSAEAIQAFIDRTPVLQGLVNIPVQLDALCYSWEEVQAQIDAGHHVTMTMLYQAMVDKLWHKDGVRLAKAEAGRLFTLSDMQGLSREEIEEQLMAAEYDYLSYLAFQGLQDNQQIIFDLTYLQQIKNNLNRSRSQKLPLQLNSDIKQTSFLHTADAHLEESKRTWHFLHLTHQEFFAAKFLAKHFEAYLSAEGEYQSLSTRLKERKGLVLEPEALQQFVAEHKYDPRYQIVWRMTAGLLEEKALAGFFHLLDKAPRDLIGRAQAELLMHGLYEARSRLSQSMIEHVEGWLEEALQVEMNVLPKSELSQLIRQSEFPVQVLLRWGAQHRQAQRRIFKALTERPDWSDQALASLIGAPPNEDQAPSSVAPFTLSVSGDQRSNHDFRRQLWQWQQQPQQHRLQALRWLLQAAPLPPQYLQLQFQLLRQLQEILTKPESIDAFGPLVASNERVRDSFVQLFTEEWESAASLIIQALVEQMINDKPSHDLLMQLAEPDREDKKEIARLLGGYALHLPAIAKVVAGLLGTADEQTVYTILGDSPDQAYLLLPHLSFEQLQGFYTEYLLPRHYRTETPIYYRDQALHFHTSTGPKRSMPMRETQFQHIARAFEAARKNLLASNTEQPQFEGFSEL